jgi:glycine cleavage system H protein
LTGARPIIFKPVTDQATMSKIPTDLKYTKSHEWLRDLPDGSVEIGITDHAQHQLGDLVFVEVPEAGRVLTAGEACAVVESVKAASDVYCPLAGEVTAGNPALAASPELINQDAFGRGWLLRLRPAGAGGGAFLSADEYAALCAAEGS